MSMPTLMDGTYFVGRNELLQWINSTLGLNLQKIEQTCNGAVACQLLDVLRPGQVQLSKVDFNAKSEYEMIGNYKVLQATFSKLGVDKDNMEFMQWMKAYFDGQTGGQAPEGYDARARRSQSRTGDVKAAAGSARQRQRSTSFNTNANGARAGGGGHAPAAARPATGRSTMPPAASPAPQAAPSAPHLPPDAAGEVSAVSATQQQAVPQGGADPAEIQALSDQIAALEVTADTAAKERDFYFGKLRDIEVMCQTPGLQNSKVVQTMERILYASNDEESKRVIAEAQAHLLAGREIDGSPAANGTSSPPKATAAVNGAPGQPGAPS